jgi:hypothetical protein
MGRKSRKKKVRVPWFNYGYIPAILPLECFIGPDPWSKERIDAHNQMVEEMVKDAVEWQRWMEGRWLADNTFTLTVENTLEIGEEWKMEKERRRSNPGQ